MSFHISWHFDEESDALQAHNPLEKKEKWINKEKKNQESTYIRREWLPMWWKQF